MCEAWAQGLLVGASRLMRDMKQTARRYSERRYPDAQQRERRFLYLALGLGTIFAGLVGLVIYFVSRGGRY